jgi:hypothetical protein
MFISWSTILKNKLRNTKIINEKSNFQVLFFSVKKSDVHIII